ncbi:hypothetical protein H1R20_g15842, partial [Candolleomyces eurysporus]
MTSKAKPTSSKPSLRWPWSKKHKGDRTVSYQPDLEDQVPTEQVVQVASPIVVAPNTATNSSGEAGEEWRRGNQTSRGATSSASGLKITQAKESSGEASSSFFPNASGFVVNGGLQINAHQHGSNSDDRSGWERLLQNTAPNALHDSKYRFDPPKCDEDTRVEVIEELVGWIQDQESPQRLLCMTGAAGSGKSALQQTVAERCSELDILSSTFFFSSTDPTRNTVSAVIPTIAYQLGANNPALREGISAAVFKDPLVFEKSLKTQMNKLIVNPMENLSREFSKSELATLPYAILIDGLDECTDEQHQAELLAAIDDCLLQNDALPFRIFIASRPEWAIRSALEDTGCLHEKAYLIQLSDQYDASGDIRRVLWRRLRDIGRRSGDPRAQSPSWPSEEDIETLVLNASGQFIYAATVIKFVSERRSSPVDRLRAILTWTPEDRAQPFAALDLLYTNIVSAAKEAYEAAHPERDFLLLLRAYQLLQEGHWTYPFFARPDMSNGILCLEDNSHRWLISDLRSLVTIQHYEIFRYYHKSFRDFLDSESRSKSLFVPESRVAEFVTVACVRSLDRDATSREKLESHDQEFYRVIQTLNDKWQRKKLRRKTSSETIADSQVKTLTLEDQGGGE